MQPAPHEPIATDYGQLQSLRFIDAAFATLSRRHRSLSRSPHVALQCIELAFFNLGELIDRSTRILQSRDDGTRQDGISIITFHSDWHRETLRVIEGLASLREQMQPRGASGPAATFAGSGVLHYLEARKAYDPLVTRILTSRGGIADAFLHLSNLNPLARLQQDLKNANLMVGRATHAYAATDKDWGSTIDCAALRSAVYDGEIKLDRDTFISQFRLFHQIPELIGRHGNELIDEAIAALQAGETDAAAERLQHVTAFNEIIVDCVYPLLFLLTPGQYHRIRDNLGQTSGSHSDVLVRGNGLFRGRFRRLQEAVGAAEATCGRRVGWPRVQLGLARFHDQAMRWRDLHKGFPRNVLGNNRTASLSGSPDAIDAVEDFQRSFARSTSEALSPLPLEAGYRSFPLSGLAPVPEALAPHMEPLVACDTRLLDATGSVTRRKYPHVQKRAGVEP